jgi:SAM-dependent methyltransferase
LKLITNPDLKPSQKILDALYQYDDFMSSIRTLVDLGCGDGKDLEWWATATTRDDSPQPLNIQCVGVDQHEQLAIARKYPNTTYQRTDFESTIHPPKSLFDVLWCHNAFQYCINPIDTLNKWREIASDGAMLVLAVPNTLAIKQRQLNYYLASGCYYHYSMVSLIHILSVTGWDCKAGFFQQLPEDPWIRAVVYKGEKTFENPKKVSWYDLMQEKVLPDSADQSIHAHGFLRQQDLVLPWIDKSLVSMRQL